MEVFFTFTAFLTLQLQKLGIRVLVHHARCGSRLAVAVWDRKRWFVGSARRGILALYVLRNCFSLSLAPMAMRSRARRQETHFLRLDGSSLPMEGVFTLGSHSPYSPSCLACMEPSWNGIYELGARRER